MRPTQEELEERNILKSKYSSVRSEISSQNEGNGEEEFSDQCCSARH